MNDLVKIEPIPLPDLRRLTTTQLWPGWLVSSIAAVRNETQLTPDGLRFEPNVPVLPADRMLTPSRRQAIERHQNSLLSCLRQTPENGTEWETKTASAVTKLLMVLPSVRRSEVGEEARSEVYMEVLDDVPYWAVVNAIRRWHRHDCGTDERGEPRNYTWAPGPGTLRQIALRGQYEIAGRVAVLGRVLEAREYVDCSADLERGRLAMRGLFKCMGDKEALAQLTFSRAVEIGASVAPAPERAAEIAREAAE